MGPQAHQAPWPVLLVLLLALPRGATSDVNVTFPVGEARFRCSTACEAKQCVDTAGGCRLYSLDPSLDLRDACSDKVCRPGCTDLDGCIRSTANPKYSPLDAPLQLLPFRYADGRGMAARWVTQDAVKLWDAASGEVASFLSFFCLKVSSSTTHGPKPRGATALSFLVSGNSSVDDDSRVVAVTFDMAQEVVVRDYSTDASSKASLNASVLFGDGRDFFNQTFGVWVDYDAATQTMKVSMLPLDDGSAADFALACNNVLKFAKSVLEYKLDLRSRVNDYSHIGFQFSASNSSSSSDGGELNQIFYWHFSTLRFQEGSRNLAKKSRNPALVTSAVVGTGLLVAGAVVVGGLLFLWLHRRRRRRYSSSMKYSAAAPASSKSRRWSGPSVPTFSTDQGAPRKFSYGELRQATNNFSAENLLGEGGFGEVFKGVLRDKCTWVAVKRIAGKSRQGEKQFLAEVTIIGRLRHRNLVPLRGWCHNKRGGELMLVYDYMPNSSLDHHVLRPSRYLSEPSAQTDRAATASTRPVLGWAARLHVIKGVAAALLYLHEEWEEVGLKSSVVHRDIKSSNILLDAEWNARLGDFGLALLVERDKTAETVSSVAGTRGYLAPEYAYTGKVSVQADTYSFGVFMLEVSTGRRPIEWFRPENERFLVQWVCHLHESGELHSAVDPQLKEGGELTLKAEEVLLVLRLGLLCTLNDPADRPSMRQVVHYLAVGDSASVVLPDSISAYQEHLARSIPSPNHRAALGSQASSQTTTTTASTGGGRSVR